MGVPETIVCPLTAKPAVFYCQKEQSNYYINPENKVIFLAPMPSLRDMLEYADHHYREGVYRDYVDARDLKLLTANIRLNYIEQYQPGKNMLDVGCASGFFLEAANARGYLVNGIEFAASAIAQAQPSVRDKIVQGDVHREIARWQEQIDWVSAFDIIEHTHDPLKFIRDISKVLKPGGLLVMSTPDTGHFLRVLMRSRWPMLQPFQHTVLFSREAMKELLLLEGFVDVSVKTAYKYLTFEYLAKQLSETNRFLAYAMKICLRLLPQKLATHPFKFNIGEFMVFARKATD